MDDLRRALEFVQTKRRQTSNERAVLVAVSGIDGSGKGYITGRLVAQLQAQGVRAVGINTDGWLNLPHKRFSTRDPAEHFYWCAFRTQEMFSQLVLPLKANRSIRLEADFTEETATVYHKHLYEFADVEVIVLEGIFLLKPDYRAHYDLSFWIDCSFETALKRALARHQEGLDEQATIRAYQTIYFPAQEIHLAQDQPREAATGIIVNDSRLPQHRK